MNKNTHLVDFLVKRVTIYRSSLLKPIEYSFLKFALSISSGGLSRRIGNIDDYDIWRTMRNRYSEIGTDDDLLLLENFNNIIIHRNSIPIIQDSYVNLKNRV